MEVLLNLRLPAHRWVALSKAKEPHLPQKLLLCFRHQPMTNQDLIRWAAEVLLNLRLPAHRWIAFTTALRSPIYPIYIGEG